MVELPAVSARVPFARRRGQHKRQASRNAFSLGGRAGLVILTALVVVAVAAPVLPIGDPLRTGAAAALAPPSSAYPLGTDQLGRPVLPRLVYALRNTLLITALSITAMTIVVCSVAMWCGFRRGLADRLVMRAVDVVATFPAILLALLIAAIVGAGTKASFVTIMLFTLPLMTRVVRSATLEIADRDFIVSARISGASTFRIVRRHVMRNVASAIVVQFTYAFAVALVVESALDFLGVGVQPPTPTLGDMINSGVEYMILAPALVIAPAAVLLATILAVTMMGDALNNWLSPVRARKLT